MQNTALIIIDVDFSLKSMSGGHIVAAIDLSKGTERVGDPFLTEEDLQQFAAGNANHGSTILTKLRQAMPDAPFVLVRIGDDDGHLIRTRWQNGEIASPGWTEGYLRAIEICRQRGYASVANASFGGYFHAMDGTGWEAHQLGKVTGQGKAGHIFVAASGDGEGKAEHASWTLGAEPEVWVDVWQSEPVHFNLWATGDTDWLIEVYRDGNHIDTIDSPDIVPNLWNGKQQVNFTVGGDGTRTTFKVVRTGSGGNTRFDCWVVAGEGRFLNHVDAELVAEPAVFAQVIAVGLVDKQYSPHQQEAHAKPDLLLHGQGPVSFRVPEVVVACARILENQPDMDVTAVLAQLRTDCRGKVW
jgi:hypothetical protein